MNTTPNRRALAIRALIRAAFHTVVAAAALAALVLGVPAVAALGWWAVCLVAIALTAVYALSIRTA